MWHRAAFVACDRSLRRRWGANNEAGVAGTVLHLKEGSVDTTTLLIIIIIVLLLGGGGWYGRGRWY
jgi:hypothetical protein